MGVACVGGVLRHGGWRVWCARVRALRKVCSCPRTSRMSRCVPVCDVRRESNVHHGCDMRHERGVRDQCTHHECDVDAREPGSHTHSILPSHLLSSLRTARAARLFSRSAFTETKGKMRRANSPFTLVSDRSLRWPLCANECSSHFFPVSLSTLSHLPPLLHPFILCSLRASCIGTCK